MPRPLREVVREIKKDWGEKVNFAARPYLDAMSAEDYGFDGKKSIVLYFLSNAVTWRGDVARRIKAELKADHCN